MNSNKNDDTYCDNLLKEQIWMTKMMILRFDISMAGKTKLKINNNKIGRTITVMMTMMMIMRTMAI